MRGLDINQSAFTLAEVLVTIGIIGVVAAMTLPTVLGNINERILSTRHADTAYKVTQATNKMKSLGLLDGSYSSTDDFVDELQKHLRIVQRCSANNIANCWPTEKVITSDGEEFEVKNAKTGKNLGIKGNTSGNVGLVLANGASLILTYDHTSKGMDEGDPVTAQPKTLPVGFGKSKDFAYTTSTTGAIDFVMDVNGKHGPNSETRDNRYHDIRSFKVARFSKGCTGVEIPGIGCVVNLGTSYDCLSKSEADKWDGTNPYDNNCWAGAQKACADADMSLPDTSTLQSIAQKASDLPQGCFWSMERLNAIGGYCVNLPDGSRGVVYSKGWQNPVLCVGD